MIAFDMGGPVNKVAFFFGAAMIKEGNFAPMGACAAAICVPPLGWAWPRCSAGGCGREQEREAGYASLAMGMIGITEGAIPFAAADPLRVIPIIMAGSMLAAVIAMLGGVGDHAPHGGPIVLPVVDNRLAYVAGHRGRLAAGGPAGQRPAQAVDRGRRRPLTGGMDMKIVAVTACPTGIAHTYMAAEQLEKTARKLGHSIKVETQGAMGIENELRRPRSTRPTW